MVVDEHNSVTIMVVKGVIDHDSLTKIEVNEEMLSSNGPNRLKVGSNF
jgi:hypothetical protein